MFRRSRRSRARASNRRPDYLRLLNINCWYKNRKCCQQCFHVLTTYCWIMRSLKNNHKQNWTECENRSIIPNNFKSGADEAVNSIDEPPLVTLFYATFTASYVAAFQTLSVDVVVSVGTIGRTCFCPRFPWRFTTLDATRDGEVGLLPLMLNCTRQLAYKHPPDRAYTHDWPFGCCLAPSIVTAGCLIGSVLVLLIPLHNSGRHRCRRLSFLRFSHLF